jgi:hypothetical protein
LAPIGNGFAWILPSLRLASPVCVGPFKNAEFADGEFIDLKRAKARPANSQTPDGHAADRKRADGYCSNRCRSHRKRQQSCGGRNLLPPGYFARHEKAPVKPVSVTFISGAGGFAIKCRASTLRRPLTALQ